MSFTYPDARRSDTTDNYHGQIVADPYRWLEDPESEETRSFVAAQNAVTMPHLRALPDRQRLLDRMTDLWDTPRTDAPTKRAGVAVWTHNDGLQDQAVYFIQRPGGEPEIFLDPNTLSDDGAVAVVLSSLAPDGRHLAYAVSEAGSDRQRLYIRNTETGVDLDDELDHLRFTSVAWYEDGFFYTRWPVVDPSSTDPVRDPSVHYHRIGTAQAADPLIFHNDEDPDPGYAPQVTQDDRYLVLTEYLGTSSQTGILYLDLEKLNLADLSTARSDGTSVDGRAPNGWVRLADLGQALHSVLLHVDDGFLVHTDRDAPKGAVVHIPLDDMTSRRTVIAEGDGVIEGATAVAGEVMILRLVDASHRIERHGADGAALGTIELPGLGSVFAISGRFDDPEVFVGYQSFLEPATTLRWQDGAAEVHSRTAPPIDPSTVVVERRSAVSSDGRDVGMFVIRPAGPSGSAPKPGPVELYGYGGFSINLTPVYSAARLAFIEAGGTVVIANLRGGVENGEEWHEQGMLANKQQVFDDFIACGEKLVDDGITTAAGLGIRGGSNGGLLTAAVMIRRPDLFGAVISQVPVTDMLRYQHFTAGRFWTVEYGDAADPEAFQWLMEYSPLHNVSDSMTYPPLLITTAESDDRVVPMHSHKFAATIQAAAGGRSENPLLLRVETRAGHGMGKPTAKVIEESADIYAFLLHHCRL